MQINIVELHRIDVTDAELNIDKYARFSGGEPYYRDTKGNWYITENDGNIYPMHVGWHTGELEKLFQEMMPFKGQLELF